MNSRYIEVADSITIMERLRDRKNASHAASSAVEVIPAMNAIDVLRAIVEEVAGASQPISTDSYLPASLVHDARQAIEQYEREQEEAK